jgi:hypothetical protein
VSPSCRPWLRDNAPLAVFFDATLMAVGNLLFVAGFPFLAGVNAALKFFAPIPFGADATPSSWMHKLRSAGLFWLGFLLVLFRWGVLGMLIELVGMTLLFSRFLRPLVQFSRSLPGIGPLLQSSTVDWLVGFAEAAPKPEAEATSPAPPV